MLAIRAEPPIIPLIFAVPPEPISKVRVLPLAPSTVELTVLLKVRFTLPVLIVVASLIKTAPLNVALWPSRSKVLPNWTVFVKMVSPDKMVLLSFTAFVALLVPEGTTVAALLIRSLRLPPPGNVISVATPLVLAVKEALLANPPFDCSVKLPVPVLEIVAPIIMKPPVVPTSMV